MCVAAPKIKMPTGASSPTSLVSKCHAEPAAAAKYLGRGSPHLPRSPALLGMTALWLFPSVVVLVATLARQRCILTPIGGSPIICDLLGATSTQST